MAAKYKAHFKEMVEQNQQIFNEFQKLHDYYAEDPQARQAEFNEKGEPVLELIQQWESRLCRKTERSGYGSYSAGLAEKFWEEVRKHYPHINSVGLVVS